MFVHINRLKSTISRLVNTAEDGEQIPPAPSAPMIFAPHTVVTRGRQSKDRTSI
jgi:hypothetical protein